MWQPLDIRRPFTRADALAAGISPKVLRGSRFRHVFRGVSVAADAPDSPFLRVEAALLLFDGAAFASHRSAARVHGVPLPPHPLEHVSVPTATLRRRPEGIRCHVCSSASVVVVRGLRVSDPRQMFVELATLLSLVDLVVVGDNLVRRGLCTLAGLVDFCASSEMAGVAAARAAASLVRDRVDSPMETRLRMLIVLAGLPEPEVNATIRDVDGAAHPALRPVLAERAGDRGVRRAPPRRARAPVGARPRPDGRRSTTTAGGCSSSRPGASTASPSERSSGSSRCSPAAASPACRGGPARRGGRTSVADAPDAPWWPSIASSGGHEGASCAS